MRYLKSTLLFHFTVLLLISFQAHSALFDTRAGLLGYETALANSFTDGYDLSNYTDGYYDNLNMTAVVGETAYSPTTFTDVNLVLSINGSTTDGAYCSGCNGSFSLDFSTTSLSQQVDPLGAGVFGVGLDVIQNSGDVWATVTYIGGSIANYAIGAGALFWGITTPGEPGVLIESIHFGGFNGAAISQGSAFSFAIDNLTIGSNIAFKDPGAVPVPAAIWLFGTALIGFVGMSKKTKV